MCDRAVPRQHRQPNTKWRTPGSATFIKHKIRTQTSRGREDLFLTELLVKLFIKHPDNIADRAVHTAYGNLACFVCIFCNLMLFAGKFIVGTIFGSVAITADAMNNLSDASSNVVSLVGFRLGAKPADDEHPYGHARYEYIAGLAVSVMILVIGVELFKESFLKVLHPTPVTFSLLTVVVLLACIAVKLWMSVFNRKIGNRIHSETLIATAADARNDVVSTSAVLIASIATYFSGVDRIDGVMGLAVAVFILWSGIGLVRDTISPILGAAPDPELIDYIEKKATSYPGVLGIHDLMIHDYGPGNKLVSFHIEMPANSDVMASHDLIDSIERDFQVHDHLLVTIHFDPVVVDDPHIQELRQFLKEKLATLAPDADIHDLRIVPGPTHTNVIFDCAVPADMLAAKDHRANKLVVELRNAVADRWKDHFCVIQLEPIYAKTK